MKTIKINSIGHAVDCIFENNLLAEFEEEVIEIKEGSNFDETIKENNITLEQLIDFLNRHGDNEKYTLETHWLEIIADEEKTSIYQIAKDGNIDRSHLYKVIERNTDFDKMSISTMNAIARGLGLSAYQFMDKYADRFSEKATKKRTRD